MDEGKGRGGGIPSEIPLAFPLLCAVYYIHSSFVPKLLAQFGTENIFITKEHTQKHLTDPQEIFSHMQKLAFLSKGNHQMLKESLMGLLHKILKLEDLVKKLQSQ